MKNFLKNNWFKICTGINTLAAVGHIVDTFSVGATPSDALMAAGFTFIAGVGFIQISYERQVAKTKNGSN